METADLRINKIYGIDYSTVIRGGVGNSILGIDRKETFLTVNEKDLITEIAKFQNDDLIINIKPFVVSLTEKKPYKIVLK